MLQYVIGAVLGFCFVLFHRKQIIPSYKNSPFCQVIHLGLLSELTASPLYSFSLLLFFRLSLLAKQKNFGFWHFHVGLLFETRSCVCLYMHWVGSDTHPMFDPHLQRLHKVCTSALLLLPCVNLGPFTVGLHFYHGPNTIHINKEASAISRK